MAIKSKRMRWAEHAGYYKCIQNIDGGEKSDKN
jgi:hypothetical protein